MNTHSKLKANPLSKMAKGVSMTTIRNVLTKASSKTFAGSKHAEPYKKAKRRQLEQGKSNKTKHILILIAFLSEQNQGKQGLTHICKS